MGLLDQVAPNLADLLRRDAWWMGWNTLLAWVPVGLALLLFRGSGPARVSRSPFWWAGLVLFALFLPNAPYVVTDLIHLRWDIMMATKDGPVVSAVLPVYAVLVGSGLLAYHLSLSAALRHLDRLGLGAWRGRAAVTAHALCAVGIFLGRWARLNSWEPVVDPHATLERIWANLTWSWAPALILATFLVTWTGHFVTRAVADAFRDAAVRSARRLRTTPTST
ncbi:DUF1361 domain-containing protein [Actinomadura fibrosa]|uniref:DUF1361 domain-containing protein n=1 Tax=Actinomadura fibrosa TaxID=111802 RepID=A0ABW2XTD8_9ACTN|nr:DUF1361 domain-containing protein [Actinomadura fibrosa]